jgi:hypothetical protein
MCIRIRIRNTVACLIRAGNLLFLLFNVFDFNATEISSWSQRDEGGEHSWAPLTVSILSAIRSPMNICYTRLHRYNTRMKLLVDSYFHHQETDL